MKPTIPYIQMDFEEGLRLKWEAGQKRYRPNGEPEFRGDWRNELYEELLDAIKYVEQGEAKGADYELQGYRTTLKNMALHLQACERELRKRI